MLVGCAESVVVFVRSGATWIEQATLTKPDGSWYFAKGISISGDTALISNYGNYKAAHVFVRSGTTWSLQAELQAIDGERGSSRNEAVAISGDTAVVGLSGGVYIFVRSENSWSQSYFMYAVASAVAIDGDTMLVDKDVFVRSTTCGTTCCTICSNDPPATCVPHQWADSGNCCNQCGPPCPSSCSTSWDLQDRLAASDPSPSLGSAVALSGNTAVLGNKNAALALVFVRSGTSWSEQATLTSDSGEGYFGNSVAINSEAVVVGAHHEGSTGSAYVFKRSGTAWSQDAKIEIDGLHPVNTDGILIGSSVAIGSDTLAAGADGERSVYTFAH